MIIPILLLQKFIAPIHTGSVESGEALLDVFSSESRDRLIWPPGCVVANKSKLVVVQVKCNLETHARTKQVYFLTEHLRERRYSSAFLKPLENLIFGPSANVGSNRARLGRKIDNGKISVGSHQFNFTLRSASDRVFKFTRLSVSS